MRVLKYIRNPTKSPSLLDLLPEFELYKIAQGRSQRTVSDYLRMMKFFYRRYPRTNSQTLKRNALLFLSQEGIKPATYNLRLIYLKSFFQYCVNNGYLKTNPLLGIKRKKAGNRIVNIELQTLNQLLNLPDKSTYTGLRDYCMMLIQLDTGARPNEVCTLSVEDFNEKAAQITIREENAKTRVSRTLPISKITLRNIKKILEVRPEEWNALKAPLFCSWNGGLFSANAYCHRFRLYCVQLGEKITPYELRHAFALNFLRNGGSVFALQKTLGHSDMTMTKRYIALTLNDMREQHEKATPINNIITQRMRMSSNKKPKELIIENNNKCVIRRDKRVRKIKVNKKEGK